MFEVEVKAGSTYFGWMLKPALGRGGRLWFPIQSDSWAPEQRA